MKLKTTLSILGFFFALFVSTTISAQEKATIKGQISLSNGEAAENVSVVLKGTKIGAVTDNQGLYEIKNVTPGNYTIRITAVGHSTKEESIFVNEGEVVTKNLIINNNSEQLEEIFVKGNANKYTKAESNYVAKMPIKNLENSQVYSVVTKDLMKDQLVVNQDEALRNVPGLYQLWASTGRIGDGGSYFSSRGFVTQSLLRNGIAGKITNNVDASNLERLESIKGPSATLFGSLLTSYGGLINRVTKKPTERFGGEISYQSGSYGLNRLTADVNTSLNDDDTALLRVNAAYNNANTFQDYGQTRSYFFAPSFSYKVNDKLSISIDAELSNVDASSMPLIYIPFDGTPNSLNLFSAKDIKMNWTRSFTGSEFMMNTKTSNIFAQANYEISDKWKSQSVLSTSTNQSVGPQIWFYLLGNNEMSRNVWNIDGRDNILEFQQNFNGEFELFGMKHRALVGGDIYRYESKSSFGLLADTFFYYDTVNYTQANTNYYDFNADNVKARLVGGSASKAITSLTTYSAYVADVFNVTDRLFLSAALRLDHYQNDGTFDPSTDVKTGNFSQNALSPKFGAVYQIIKDQVSVFGNYQNSFKNVGFAFAEVGGIAQLKAFDPERANQFEAGVKVNAFSNRVSATLSYYNIEVKNILRAGQLINTSVQDGNQTSKGFEAEVTANPISGLNLIFGYAFNNSKLNDADAPVNGLRPETAGPESLLNYWISYSLQTSKFKGLGIGFGGNSASETYAFNRNVTDPNTNVTTNQKFTLPSYTVINAALYYDQPKYRLSLKVNNLTDELYFNGYTTINVQAPRTFMGSVAYKF
ncbi:TonB-dependent receptor [Flavobacterium hercynium]|uniref:TonB-dependent siderophore receptor n=1 Tax=Flavobacterium hercynium TaxID=387094 RepID=A0A226HF43_9FLAO|nr:TonB-dependent receptor [Flavobacterium hercynium]OXA92714.1 TonB-dependent siderophore receptor [Flavobacterium hercynium]SMP01243.1 iron complex outermembrane recepter protein [Flavobacterium hercynium]